MKLAFRTLLVIAICAMSYLCVTSITVPIEFEQEQAKREQQIIKKLVLRRCIDCKSEKKEDCKCQIAFHQQMFFHSAETKVEMHISGRKSCITVFSKTQKIFQWTQKFTLTQKEKMINTQYFMLTQNPAGLKRRFFPNNKSKNILYLYP